jgi:hypothetical protein
VKSPPAMAEFNMGKHIFGSTSHSGLQPVMASSRRVIASTEKERGSGGSARTKRTIGLAALAIAVLSLGASACDDGESNDTGAFEETANDDDESTSSETEGAALTEIDLRIARLVESRGEQLDLTSTQFFGDVDFGAVKRLGTAGLGFVAPTRLRIAERMEKDAIAAIDALAKLAPKANVATDVAERGEAAFGALKKCATRASAFWAGVVGGDADAGGLRNADRSCEDARAVFAEAEVTIEELPEVPAETTTGDVVAAGEEARVVVGVLDPDDPQAQDMVQPVSLGSRVTIVLDAKNTSAFEWRLKNGCDGPLTFSVSLLINTEGSPAIDPAEAGYSSSNSPTKDTVEATVKGQERFELDVGTFTVPDDASGATSLLISLAENRCPDPATGSSYSPISVGAGSSRSLILEVTE